MDPWLQTAPGRYLLDWERTQFDRAVGDLFGFHAVQLGLPQLDTLACNRMPHRWVALRDEAQLDTVPAAQTPCLPVPRALISDFEELPFDTASLDLVVLPHTLELAHDPHQTLREVDRVLVPGGHVVIAGFNPASLWGVRQRCGRIGMRLGVGSPFLPTGGEFIGYRRLRDWLRLMSLDIETGRFGCYRPALRSELWLQRFDWMEDAGDRWWPVFGAVYFLVAVKRVRGMRLIGPAWKRSQKPGAAPAVVAHHHNKEGL